MKTKLLSTLLIALLSIVAVSCKLFNSITEKQLFPVTKNGVYLYLNADGEVAINPQFSLASYFNEGLALVQELGDSGKIGFIDYSGKYVIQPDYLTATLFSEGIAWVVKKNGAPMAIDKNGHVLFKLDEAQVARCYSQGLAPVQVYKNGYPYWGFVSKTGVFEIQPQFENVLFFTEDLCAVQKEGVWGFINETGRLVIPYRYSKVGMFNNGRAVYSIDGQYGLIDKSGKTIINAIYETMDNDGNLYMIKLDGKMGWCDRNGKTIINPIYREIQPFNESDIAAVSIDGEKWGYINIKNETVIAPQFTMALPFNKNCALASIDGQSYGLINKNGVFTTEQKYSVDLELIPRYDYVLNEYMFVNNQKFDTTPIFSQINFDQPEEISLSSTISSAIKYFELSQSDLQIDGDLHLVKERYFSDDMLIKTYIIATPYSDSNDRFSYNPNKKIDGIAYGISGNTEEKNNIIYDEILKYLDKSSYVELKSSENISIYKGDDKYIYIEKKYDQVAVAFFNMNVIKKYF